MGERRVAVVVGAGPGLGAAVAERFAREGFDVALTARRADTMEAARKAVEGHGRTALALPCDATDPAAVAAAFATVRERFGDADVLVYNAGAFQPASVLDISPELFDSSWRANCSGGFLSAREVLPAMVKRGRGTVIFTGATASLRGSANFACLAVGKFGLRALAQSMARELGPKGVHVAHVIVDGPIDTARVRTYLPDRPQGTLLDPAAIAETYWQLHTQRPSVWTLEMDVRPSAEKF
jgi:NAD(P)-dependent dehydrogenase (short-subunit alcohol dehydrogenase family)